MSLMSKEGLFFQGVFAQFENGQLEQETYEAYLLWFCSLISTPGGAYVWNESLRPVFVPKMVKVVDERMLRGNLVNVLEQAQYKLKDDA